MAENSKIEWTDHTFNGWYGCTKVSPACDHCYAEVSTPARVSRSQGNETWGPHAPRKRTSASNWKKPLKWNKEAEAEGVRKRVFCLSLGDVFDNHKSIEQEWRDDLWALIRATPHLDWQLLTKRPQNIKKYLPDDWGDGYPNVWLGTTVENQEEADRRIPHLLDAPAAIRFLSCEPLLENIDIRRWLFIHWQCSGCRGYFNDSYQRVCPDCGKEHYWTGSHKFNGRNVKPNPIIKPQVGSGIDWVIIGGESGHNARPMHPNWPFELMEQCRVADIPKFFKQWGEWHPDDYRGREFGHLFKSYEAFQFSEFDGQYMFRVGKKRAGNLLDGSHYLEFPNGGANV